MIKLMIKVTLMNDQGHDQGHDQVHDRVRRAHHGYALQAPWRIPTSSMHASRRIVEAAT